MTSATCRFLRLLFILTTVPVLAAALNGCAGKTEGIEAQAVYQTPDGIAIVDTFTTVATITAIDAKTRKVTLQTPDGKSSSYKAAKGVDLTQFSVGQSIGVQLSEETALDIRKGGTPAPSAAATALAAGSGNGTVAVFDGEAIETSAKITLINPKARTVTFQLADGKIKSLKVHKSVDLTGLAVGDVVTVKYAVSVLVAVANP